MFAHVIANCLFIVFFSACLRHIIFNRTRRDVFFRFTHETLHCKSNGIFCTMSRMFYTTIGAHAQIKRNSLGKFLHFVFSFLGILDFC